MTRERLNAFIEAGLISERRHPEAPLWIYNYTSRAVYERRWTAETLACRGLILDDQNRVVARPFEKFFNLHEHSRSDIIFRRPFTVTEKVDGSLGVYYEANGTPAIATRGAFDNDQARWATAHLALHYAGWRAPQGVTPLFEIIYPANRIVIDYEGREALVLLAVINNETGLDEALESVAWPGPVVRHFEATGMKPRDIAEALGQDDGNSEGFVLRFEDRKRHIRVKVKLSEYTRLHRLVTGVSNKSIWEALRAGSSLDELLDRVPDEFYDWVRQEQSRQVTEHAQRVAAAMAHFEALCASLPDGWGRKEFALAAQKQDQAELLFLLLDSRDIADRVWRSLEPEYSRPFKRDIDS